MAGFPSNSPQLLLWVVDVGVGFLAVQTEDEGYTSCNPEIDECGIPTALAQEVKGHD